MAADRPLVGIFLMVGFCVLAPMGDAAAKYLGATFPIFQLVFLRFAFQAVLLLPVLWVQGTSLWMNGYLLRMTFYRTLLQIIGVATIFTAFRFLPLADALAIAYVMPFIILLLAKTLLHEPVGARRLIACMVGFTGTLLVIQPSFMSVGLPALLPLATAVIFAFFMLATRKIAKDVDPVALQTMNGLMGTILLAAVFAASLLIDSAQAVHVFRLVAPNAFQLALLVGFGLLGTFAHLVMTWSLRFAPTSTVAPVQYLEIPVAAVIGWWVFRDLPNGMAAVGIVVTISAGLYVIYRERQLATEAASPINVP